MSYVKDLRYGFLVCLLVLLFGFCIYDYGIRLLFFRDFFVDLWGIEVFFWLF